MRKDFGEGRHLRVSAALRLLCSNCQDGGGICIVMSFCLCLLQVISLKYRVTLQKQPCRPVCRCGVEAISFSAHADFDQTSGFLDALQPPDVVLVHGEVRLL